MERIYGIPAIQTHDTVDIVPAWSQQLARILAARDAAIVAATGSIPEGDPNTVEGIVTRMAAAEAVIDLLEPGQWVRLTLRNGWSNYSGGGGYFPGLRARSTPHGTQIQGMVSGGPTNSSIAALPADLAPDFATIFTAPVSSGATAHCGITVDTSIGAGVYAVRYNAGPGSPGYVAIDVIVPAPLEPGDTDPPAPGPHTHQISDITGLQAALDSKRATTAPGISFDTDGVPYVTGDLS